MNRFPRLLFPSSFLVLVVYVAGCGSGTKTDPPHDHDHTDAHPHDHSHVDEHGPNGGHLIRLEPAEYTAEWDHDDKAETVTVIILDKGGTKEVAVGVNSVVIEANIESKIDYPLDAVSPSADDPPQASRFQRKNAELLTALKMTEGDTDATASLVLTVDGKTYRGKIEHHDHGHKH